MDLSAPAQGESSGPGSEAAQATGRAGHSPAGQIPLGELQRSLAQAVQYGRSKQEVVDTLSQLLARYASAVAVVYLQRDKAGQLTTAGPGNHDELNGVLGASDQDWRDWSAQACQAGQIFRRNMQGQVPAVVFSVPVLLPRGLPEAFCVVFRAVPEPAHGIVLLMQSIAIGVQLWHVQHDRIAMEDESKCLSAILDLVTKIQSADTPQHAAQVVAGELQEFLNCERVALALTDDDATCCHIQAMSGVANFDVRSAYVRAVEAALDEALLRDELTVWPAADDKTLEAALAHQKLAATAGCDCVVSSPLRDPGGRTVGAWLFLGDGQLGGRTEAIRFIHAAGEPVAAGLVVLDDARRGLPARVTRAARRQWRSRGVRITLGGIGVVLLVLCLPWPYKLACDSRIEPVKRRFVVAPFDVRLEKALVEPGDLVTSGQVLAQLDGRELRWELAGLEADLNRARKERDTAMAGHKTAEAQIAKLEMDGLELKIRLNEHRSGQLEIKSPTDGIVVTGDLERVEGAPLSIGDTLFEVAPLDEMIVETAIPEDEIAYVREGQEVRIKLDAYPDRTWTGTLRRIHPRSEMRDQQSVFVGEVQLKNEAGLLRPGMNGEAKIVGSWRALGWIWFHRAAGALAQSLGW